MKLELPTRDLRVYGRNSATRLISSRTSCSQRPTAPNLRRIRAIRPHLRHYEREREGKEERVFFSLLTSPFLWFFFPLGLFLLVLVLSVESALRALALRTGGALPTILMPFCSFIRHREPRIEISVTQACGAIDPEIPAARYSGSDMFPSVSFKSMH